MRVLVTGATGFIGYHVARRLVQAGYSVRALVRPNSPRRARLDALGVEPVVGDLVRGQELASAVAGCEAVFHVAALYSLDRRDDERMYRTNVEGTRALVAAVEAGGRPRLVYTSSVAAVGLTDDGSPADERRFADPATAAGGYKRSKILAERIVMDAIRHGRIDGVIVNPSTPIGAGDVRPTPTGRLVQDAVFGRMPGYVNTGLNFVAVDDVAVGHLLALERGVTGDRYILGHQNMTLAELLTMAAGLAGVRPPRLRIPLGLAMAVALADEAVWSPLTGRPVRVPIAGVALARKPMYFTAAKAVTHLGLPQTPIHEALGQAIAWFQHERLAARPEERNE